MAGKLAHSLVVGNQSSTSGTNTVSGVFVVRSFIEIASSPPPAPQVWAGPRNDKQMTSLRGKKKAGGLPERQRTSVQGSITGTADQVLEDG